jgi:hypothetical protein
MTEDQLRDVIEHFKAGGKEETLLDLKRDWWKFGLQQQQDEFRKDVSAMANAVTLQDGPRHIVIGLDEDGSMHDAPLPRDEAQIQQLLAGIEPVPHVRLVHHVVEGIRLWVLVVEPPFDPPYVAKENGDRHLIHIRRGSTTTTASRRDLDRYYAALGRRVGVVSISWAVAPVEHAEGSEEEDEGEVLQEPEAWGSTVALAPPLVAPRSELLQTLENAAEEARKVLADSATHKAVGQAAESFLERHHAFLQAIGTGESGYQAWYLERHGALTAVPVVFHMENSGRGEARDIEFSLALPPWLSALEEKPVRSDDAPDCPDPPDLAQIAARESEREERRRQRARDRDANASLETDTRTLASLAANLAAIGRESDPHGHAARAAEAAAALQSGWPGDHYGALADLRDAFDVHDFASRLPIVMPEFVDSDIRIPDPDDILFVDDGEVHWRARALLHDHVRSSSAAVYLTALPGAPAGEHELACELFHHDLDRHERVMLRVSIG